MADRDWRELASRVWPRLSTLAAEGRTVTYGVLGQEVGAHPRGQLPKALALIQDHCEFEADLPPLTILVRNADTGVPGDGFYNHNRGREEDVFRFDWSAIENPFP